jgi:hypothetical protein
MVVPAPAPATAKAAADPFTGDVWVDGITGGAGPGCARLAAVRFSPGARTAWHCHANGQTLHVKSGQGLVQTRTGHTIAMLPGDAAGRHGLHPARDLALARCDARLLHDSPRARRQQRRARRPDVEWGELVSDVEYDTARTHVTKEGAMS